MSEWTRDILHLIFWISLGGTVYTYFFYPLLLAIVTLFVRRLRKENDTMDDASDNILPRITMVISAYNEATVLPEKIANCQQLNYPPDKITFLIGSDGSEDGTRQILRKIKDNRFRTFHSHKRLGKVCMLNRLIMKMPVKGDIVVFSDANTMYEPDAIRHLVKPFKNSDVGCVIGKLHLSAQPDDHNACRPEGLYWRYENQIKQMENVLGAVSSINGGIFAIRSELYEPLPENAVTEDQVLGMKIMVRGYYCRFNHQARAYESVSNWAGELRRRIRISAGNFQSLLLVPGILNPWHGRVWFTFISHKVLRWLVPLFLLFMLAANILLVGEAFYGSTLILQGLFYATGILSMALPKLGLLTKIMSIPKYFLVMNVAILLGLMSFLSHRQKVTWARVPRG
ncbi:MAG: glycosyltransferase family 2 protein [Sedimentisphaerales bacterium]|nr:glycosyltransferase family 2 protein [Sedimentisphaerales bacterium]